MNANSTTKPANPQGSKTPWNAEPWTCHANTCIMDHKGNPIAETSGFGNDVDLCETDAAMIVKAVNEHAALVAVAEAARQIPTVPDIAVHWTKVIAPALETLSKVSGGAK